MYLVPLVVLIYGCCAAGDSGTYGDLDVGSYNGGNYYSDYYDWDDDLDSDLCWPVGVCLQSYNSWATSDSDTEYSHYYHNVSEICPSKTKGLCVFA